MLVDNRIVKSFVNRVREKLLDFDLDREADVVEAPDALALGLHRGGSGDEDAVVKRLEAHVELHVRALPDPDDEIAERFVDGRVDLELAHLSGAMQEVEHRNGERGSGEV